MKVTIVQNDIIWEHKSANLMYYDSILSSLAGKTDLVVLPEMCTTGFSMKSAELAEFDYGETIKAFGYMAEGYEFAIAGSFMGKGPSENTRNRYYNRGFFIHPNGRIDYYNKRHLFRMGEEPKHYFAGEEKTIIKYKGWNILMIICYDLRFPIWTRNKNNEYDLLLVSANWPESRIHAWDSLLTARAIENMTYVCGVNRIGTDGMKINYSGGSKIIDAYGTIITSVEPDIEQIHTVEIDLESLNGLRERFPVWKDADKFQLL